MLGCEIQDSSTRSSPTSKKMNVASGDDGLDFVGLCGFVFWREGPVGLFGIQAHN